MVKLTENAFKSPSQSLINTILHYIIAKMVNSRRILTGEGVELWRAEHSEDSPKQIRLSGKVVPWRLDYWYQRGNCAVHEVDEVHLPKEYQRAVEYWTGKDKHPIDGTGLSACGAIYKLGTNFVQLGWFGVLEGQLWRYLPGSESGSVRRLSAEAFALEGVIESSGKRTPILLPAPMPVN